MPVTVEFRCPPSRFTAIVDALETAGIAVVQADSEVYAGRLTVLLVGHVVGDLSATLSEVERAPAASVVDLSLSASEGTSDVSVARLRLAVSPANGGASEALSAVRDAADRRNLRTIAPVETVEPTTGGDGTSTSHDPTVPTGDRRERTAAPAATTPQEDLRLAVMGAGVVGRAVCRAADDCGHRIVALADSTGAAVDADGFDTAAALDRKSERGRVGSGAPADALEAAYDVLVEATPTTLGDAQPGFGHAARALERDRSVVMANKGPVAERYADLQARASESDGRVRFGATVGGAVPLLSTIAGFGAANVDSVRGVFNGTANFVCSRMAAEGLSYEHVLAEAQDLGVAETDPSLDVEGTDAALKCRRRQRRLGARVDARRRRRDRHRRPPGPCLRVGRRSRPSRPARRDCEPRRGLRRSTAGPDRRSARRRGHPHPRASRDGRRRNDRRQWARRGRSGDGSGDTRRRGSARERLTAQSDAAARIRPRSCVTGRQRGCGGPSQESPDSAAVYHRMYRNRFNRIESQYSTQRSQRVIP